MPSFDASLLSEALLFSASDVDIEAGGTHELAVPMSEAGGYIVYEYKEASDEGVRFTISAADGRVLLDELQPRSEGQLHVPRSDGVLMVRWANTEAWIAAVTLGYSVRVISIEAVRARMEQRLLQAAQLGPASAIAECLAAGASVASVDAKGFTALLRAALADHTAGVSALLSAGASVTDHDRHGNTPLHLAALAGASRATVDALLAGGADADAVGLSRPAALAPSRSRAQPLSRPAALWPSVPAPSVSLAASLAHPL